MPYPALLPAPTLPREVIADGRPSNHARAAGLGAAGRAPRRFHAAAVLRWWWPTARWPASWSWSPWSGPRRPPPPACPCAAWSP